MYRVFKVPIFLVLSFLWVGFAVTHEIELSSISTSPQPQVLAAVTQPQQEVPSASEISYMAALNSYRQMYDLPPVGFSYDANRVAKGRVDDMIFHDYFSHTNLQGSTYVDVLQSPAGYSCENLLLADTADSTQIIAAWQQSRTHNECLLAPRVTAVGFAAARYTLLDDGTEQYIVAAIAVGN